MTTFRIAIHNFGFFRLDGGAMFGSVPKNLWSGKISADSENCIALATNSLVIKKGGRQFLIDVGLGSKWKEKEKKIFAINNLPPSPLIDGSRITDIILTHLHFDHAGGISYLDSKGELKLSYPNANIYLQKENLLNAQTPSLKERASYLKENVDILSSAKLILTGGSQEIYPGITVHQVNGHTKGQQYVEINCDGELILFATDLIPTAHHLPVSYHMGYDICGETVMKEKSDFLKKALDRNATVVFQHDVTTCAGKIGINEKGHYCLKHPVEIAREL